MKHIKHFELFLGGKKSIKNTEDDDIVTELIDRLDGDHITVKQKKDGWINSKTYSLDSDQMSMFEVEMNFGQHSKDFIAYIGVEGHMSWGTEIGEADIILVEYPGGITHKLNCSEELYNKFWEKAKEIYDNTYVDNKSKLRKKILQK